MEEEGSDTGSTAPRPARVARAPRPAHLTDSEAASTVPALGDDADERRYCFCNNVSYGDMIGCDGDDCEREWVCTWLAHGFCMRSERLTLVIFCPYSSTLAVSACSSRRKGRGTATTVH